MNYVSRIIGYKKVSFSGKDNKIIEGYRFYFAKTPFYDSSVVFGCVDPFDKFVFINREELLSKLFGFYTCQSLVHLLYNERGSLVDVKEADDI